MLHHNIIFYYLCYKFKVVMVTFSKKNNTIVDMWNCLTEEEKELLGSKSHVKHFSRGDKIYTVGTEAKYLMCIHHGKVKLVKENITVGKTIVHLLAQNDIFGFRAFFDEGSYFTTAVALDDCDIFCMPITVINELMNSNSSVALFMIRHLATKLGFSDRRVLSLTQKHVRGRLAETLQYVEDSFGVDADGALGVKLSRDEIASLSNMTTNNAIRTLSAFAQEGVVKLEGKRIFILDHKELGNISRLG